MEGKKLMYDALIAQCEAERTEALFTLNNYIENSVGIGEHPDIIQAIDTQLIKIAEAEDKILALDKHFEKDW